MKIAVLPGDGIGKEVTAQGIKALKAAVMVEDVAKTAWLARQLGRLKRMEDSEIEKWWSRYHSTYGQE